ncbi:RagB/SusD family nutrient uptake outer membrane protein, partial [Persicobacter diffluens]|uniref:RagB/SusD family nutrient uptake outer membrane protein n=1 Tax=Persicobacter diffluens TaxID=981 RepID=UPI0030C67B8B
MKKLFLFLILLGGCNFLDLDPIDRISSDTYYSSVEEAHQALISCYEPIRRTRISPSKGFPLYSLSLFCTTMSDDANGGAITIQSGNPYQEANLLDVNPARSEAFWARSYSGIARVNNLLDNWSNIQVKPGEESAAQYIQAEAYFLRAHYYFELLRLYENVILTTSGQIGANNFRDFEQEDPHVVYAQATEDFLKAIPLMAESTEAIERGRVHKYGAAAELIKMFMFYTGFYQKDALPLPEGGQFTRTEAIALAEDIMTKGPATLATNYADIFHPVDGDYHPEVLFEIPFMDGEAWPAFTNGLTGNLECRASGPISALGNAFPGSLFGPGWANGTVRRSLVDIFEPQDDRLPATIIDAQTIIDSQGGAPLVIGWQHTGLYSNKYSTHTEIQPAISPNTNYSQNYHYIRLADIYLLAAEMYYDAGNVGKALSLVNDIRGRANASIWNSFANGKESILEERRRELALEGHRYHDLLRQGLNYAKSKLDVKDYQLDEDPDNPVNGDVGKASDFEVTFRTERRGF